MDDLEEAIRIGREAVDATPKDHPHRAAILNNLGTSLGTMSDLEESIRIGREAVKATPQDDPDRAEYLNKLGNRLGSRYLRTGAMSDLEESIRMIQEAVQAIPQGHSDRVMHLSNLGVRLGDRYSRTGAMSDLEESIRIGREAVQATPQDHSDRAGSLNNFGVRLGDQYSRTGAMSDLEESIRMMQEAVQATPQDHSDRAAYLNNLGMALGDRYSRTGAMSDLEESIRIIQEAVQATPQDHIDHAGILHNLGKGLGDRYSRTGAMSDLEESIRIGREAVKANTQDHPHRAMFLNSLGVSLNGRYSRTGAISDLEESIRMMREAVQATPQDHARRTMYLNNLGTSLGDRYSRTGEMSDLEESIRIGREAVQATSQDHPDRAGRLHNLGKGLGVRYSRTGAISDLEDAILFAESALAQTISPTINRLHAFRLVLIFCEILSDWKRAYSAAETALPLIPRLTSRSIENSDKQHLLSEVVGIACDGAAVALYTERDPLDALNFLEQGRGVLAASLQELRIDVLDLKEKHPELAEQFEDLRQELDSPITESAFLENNSRISFGQDRTTKRYDANKKLDEVIEQIRQLYGFEDFLLPPSKEEMLLAARAGPLVVINVSRYRCDAILVEQHQIRSLHLPKLTIEEINKRSNTILGSPRTLEWLWDVIVQPILNALGFTQPPSDDNWPHIWWIPTGPLSKFPLHAAGYHGGSSTESALDRVMSSYSSSVKAIIHGRRRPALAAVPHAPARALLVTMQNTPNASSLLFAKKETTMLQSLLTSKDFKPLEPKPHKQDILSHLPDCKIFHFAGHGETYQKDPSQSSLLLEGDPLRVSDLLEMNLRMHPLFLAYLSACGTGQIKDDKFFDESIHLISAYQLAGFRHVVGTLWEVNDEICVDMAQITYEEMMNRGMTDESPLESFETVG
ncbi:TPR domain-containing protein [Rutstroemia sp. NJR-2017a BBW]|nr:TPR domain-containing protein [Rutstroemia sp. NJR-2017a BBW]